MTGRSRSLAASLILAVVAVLGLAACGGDDGGGGGEASLGEEVYSSNCARCHGPDGEGGIGPQLGGGAVVENLPDVEDQITVIREGRNAMPAWEGTLSPEEIQAVVDYTRTELGQ